MLGHWRALAPGMVRGGGLMRVQVCTSGMPESAGNRKFVRLHPASLRTP
jgi:hypothetical protein